MRNIFKILIPGNSTQEVTELESWTLCWKIQGSTFGSKIVQHKSFIDKDECKEFGKQLKNAAEFLGTWVEVTITKN